MSKKKTDPKIPALLAGLRGTLEASRATMRELRDITAESNWELWTQWEETLMRMVACIDGAEGSCDCGHTRDQHDERGCCDECDCAGFAGIAGDKA